MSENAFVEISEKINFLSYEQSIFLMEKLLKNLQNKKSQAEYENMENEIVQHSMNNVWEELKDDTW